MRAVQIPGAGRAELVELPEPKSEAGEVLVRLGGRALGGFGSALVPYSFDVLGNSTLLFRDVRTW
jgi:hypothetical protein